MARGFISLLLALLTAASIAAGPAHAGDPTFNLHAAKEKGGPYELVSRVGIKQDQAKTTWWRVKSKAAAPLDLNFADAGIGSTPGYKVTWFRGGENISDEVKDLGYDFGLAPGQSKYFSSRIKRNGSEPETCVEAEVFDEAVTQFAAASMGVNRNDCIL